MDYSAMEGFDGGQLHNGFYRRFREERACTIDECLAQIPFDDCYIISPGASEDVVPYSSGKDFLCGSCHLFAAELHRRFGYDVYEVNWGNGAVHWFAQATYRGQTVYIDVRGATTSYDELISPFHRDGYKHPVPQKRQGAELLSCDDWDDTGRMFANAVISEYIGYYNLAGGGEN